MENGSTPLVLTKLYGSFRLKSLFLILNQNRFPEVRACSLLATVRPRSLVEKELMRSVENFANVNGNSPPASGRCQFHPIAYRESSDRQGKPLRDHHPFAVRRDELSFWSSRWQIRKH